MNLQRDLIFVRHAPSIGNVISSDERALLEIPNHNYPLTDLGRDQATITGRYLKDKFGIKRPRIYLQSTFRRSEETMGIIQKELGIKDKPTTDERLDEKWDGIFHELTKKELAERYPDQIRMRKLMGYYHYRAPGGENCPDVELRIRSFYRDYFESYSPVDMILVGHGRWFILFQKLIHNLTVSEFLELKRVEKCENTSVTLYRVLGQPPGIPEPYTPWKGMLPEISTENA